MITVITTAFLSLDSGSSLTVSMSSTVLIGRFVASKVLSISLILVVLEEVVFFVLVGGCLQLRPFG